MRGLESTPRQLALPVEGPNRIDRMWGSFSPAAQERILRLLAAAIARILNAGEGAAMSNKVERQHLERKAYVYVRQSTMAQVERNVESRERQYEFVERAVSLGWSRAEVVVLDGDTARSAKSTDGRDEFQQLVAEVGLGRVGIVLGIEVSPLSRRNADWYGLLDLCALTDTLIADIDGIYHPRCTTTGCCSG